MNNIKTDNTNMPNAKKVFKGVCGRNFNNQTVKNNVDQNNLFHLVSKSSLSKLNTMIK